MADGKVVLKDLAGWMHHQKTAKRNGKLIPLREEKLNSIGFVWNKKEHEWHAMFCAVKRFKEKEERWPRQHQTEGQARGGVGRWQTSAEGLGKVDVPSKERQRQWKDDSTPGRDVERD